MKASSEFGDYDAGEQVQYTVECIGRLLAKLEEVGEVTKRVRGYLKCYGVLMGVGLG